MLYIHGTISYKGYYYMTAIAQALGRALNLNFWQSYLPTYSNNDQHLIQYFKTEYSKNWEQAYEYYKSNGSMPKNWF